MKYFKKFSEWLNESSSLENTIGMGNVTPADISTTGNTSYDSGDHFGNYSPKRKNRDKRTDFDSWKKPSSDYSKRKWLSPNYDEYMDTETSPTRFTIGDHVCIKGDDLCRTYVVVAYQDRYLRIKSLYNNDVEFLKKPEELYFA